jgi:tripartite-type tricarboxylate transporter receptor subunit TctC
MRRPTAFVVAALLGLAHIGSAAAQSAYPSRTVRFLLPYGAGSATDTAARLFADGLGKLWGKPVIVDNRPGGDGLVSLSAFTQAKDDHVLWFGPAGAFTALPYMHDTLPFDPSPAMNPVVSISVVVLAISVPASLKVDTMSQLVAMARSEPGKLNAAAANGISDFLLFGFFKKQGLQVAEVPYRDIMQAPSDMLAGRVQVLSSSLAVPQPLANAGRLKIRVVTSKRRAPSQPDVPTAIEAGYPDLTFESIGGVFGPPGMPAELRNRIAADFRKVASANPLIEQRLAATGQIMSLRSPDQFAAAITEQRETLTALAKTLGLKAATPSAR